MTSHFPPLAAAVIAAFAFSVPAVGESPDAAVQAQPVGESILGAWEARSFHASFGSLFQARSGARVRRALVYLVRDGDRIRGHAEVPGYRGIEGQGDWDGTTKFSSVELSADEVLIEFDVRFDGHPTKVRIRAAPVNERLVGSWSVVDSTGAAAFRGRWEAVRSEEP